MAKKKNENNQENVEIVNLHAKHRSRMDERFRRTGFIGWSDYEILEYMLYATIKRGNTSEHAHLLMNKFGTLENVTSASIDELMEVDGIGRASARHLSTLGEYFIHMNAKTTGIPRKFDLSTEKTVKYVKSQFNGKKEECVIMICLDSENRLIRTETIAQGTFHHADIDIIKTARLAVASNAAKVIFAHNHPSGNAVPSEDDIRTTDWLTSAFSTCSVTVLEHIIVTKDSVGLVKKYQKTGNPYPDMAQPVKMKSYNKNK